MIVFALMGIMKIQQEFVKFAIQHAKHVYILLQTVLLVQLTLIVLFLVDLVFVISGTMTMGPLSVFLVRTHAKIVQLALFVSHVHLYLIEPLYLGTVFVILDSMMMAALLIVKHALKSVSNVLHT